jgi:hypothetical protein
VPEIVEADNTIRSQAATIGLLVSSIDTPQLFGYPFQSMSDLLQSVPILQSALQRLSEGVFVDLVTQIRRGTRVILVSEPARAWYWQRCSVD